MIHAADNDPQADDSELLQVKTKDDETAISSLVVLDPAESTTSNSTNSPKMMQKSQSLLDLPISDPVTAWKPLLEGPLTRKKTSGYEFNSQTQSLSSSVPENQQNPLQKSRSHSNTSQETKNDEMRPTSSSTQSQQQHHHQQQQSIPMTRIIEDAFGSLNSNLSGAENVAGFTTANFFSDSDANIFGQSFDKWVTLMKRAVLADFMDVKTEMTRRQERAIEETGRRYVDTVASLTTQLRDSQDLLSLYGRRMECKNELLERMASLVARRDHTARCAIFMSRWRTKLAEHRQLKLAQRIANAKARQSMLRKALLGWQRTAGATWRRAMEKRVRVEAERAMEQLANEYQRQLLDIQNRLTVTEEKLATSEAERNRAQENMKKALMRGVCALNMEAMSVFREDFINGGKAGGTQFHREEPARGSEYVLNPSAKARVETGRVHFENSTMAEQVSESGTKFSSNGGGTGFNRYQSGNAGTGMAGLAHPVNAHVIPNNGPAISELVSGIRKASANRRQQGHITDESWKELKQDVTTENASSTTYRNKSGTIPTALATKGVLKDASHLVKRHNADNLAAPAVSAKKAAMHMQARENVAKTFADGIGKSKIMTSAK
ncbi:Centrosomal protein poc5 [Blyttiomyces sp. JEL0837]|nr:Centrosomal protein poc5 [Blyttiomyces sp. JEL0837]